MKNRKRFLSQYKNACDLSFMHMEIQALRCNHTLKKCFKNRIMNKLIPWNPPRTSNHKAQIKDVHHIRANVNLEKPIISGPF